MKAILLAGGRGTRLRPLTLHTPKPIVPIFDRPFLDYQIELLRRVPEIDEVILSLNYQPRRIEEMFGDGAGRGLSIRYVVEPVPLGTGGAVKYAGDRLTDSVVVFNGDVLTAIDLDAVIRLHRERRATATIVLTPVPDPTAYGLVETDDLANVRRFIEKPDPSEITTNLINAGIYVLEPETFDRIPRDVSWSIERSYFPSLVEDGSTFVAYVYDGYWIDIGTPEKYLQVHRDIMDGRFEAAPFKGLTGDRILAASTARVDPAARLEGPCFLDEGVTVKAGAHVGPHAIVGRQGRIDEGARVSASILWPNARVGAEATVQDAIVGRSCHVGRSAIVTGGAVLGDRSTLTDFSRL
ncbi:MAG: NDP-sugar synthase [Acidimicrobiia bacterium]|nr:NDP-sugar synthase [Acidimicrobiia bacterium]